MLEPDAIITLSKGSKDYHHMVNVLRLNKGEQIEIVVRDLWTTWLCQIEAIDEQGVQFRCLKLIESIQLPFEISLILGFSKGDTNERVVRQATELGAGRIIPTLFGRSISRPDPKKAQAKIERLRKLALSAAQQSHRSGLPHIEGLHSFADMLKCLDALQPDLIVVPWEEETQVPLWKCLEDAALPQAPQPTHLAVIIGPEGGISLDEIDQLHELGAQSVSLGPTILRVDTAVVASLATASSILSKRLARG